VITVQTCKIVSFITNVHIQIIMSNSLNALASGTQTLTRVSPRPACSHRQLGPCYLFCAYTSFDPC